jgi:hypothetical protein
MGSPPERDDASVAQCAVLDQHPMTSPDLVMLVAAFGRASDRGVEHAGVGGDPSPI